MKNYTEPVIEIVAIEAADVITASTLRGLFTGVGVGGIEDGGHSSLSAYKMDNPNS